MSNKNSDVVNSLFVTTIGYLIASNSHFYSIGISSTK